MITATNKATGHDQIPAKILKWTIHIMADLLAKIFNAFIEKGEYPQEFKIARVVALHKKGPKDEGDNYRPISILTQLNKVLEKIIHKRLMCFLNEEDILNHKQFGFRKNHNTTQGVLSLTELIKECLDKNKVCAALFIDLKAAFDTIDIPIMLSKLEHYGIRNNALKLFSSYLSSSYLSNRFQYIKYGNLAPTLVEILCGVPQGSVLGPLLFILYINDLSGCSNLIPNLFADDAAFLASANDTKTLESNMNSELNNVHEWMIANKLTLNYTKTKVMLFSKKRKGQKIIEISINQNKIEKVKSFKYLGAVMDSKVNWRNHIETLCTKISQATGAILKLRKIVSKKNYFDGV